MWCTSSSADLTSNPYITLNTVLPAVLYGIVRSKGIRGVTKVFTGEAESRILAEYREVLSLAAKLFLLEHDSTV